MAALGLIASRGNLPAAIAAAATAEGHEIHAICTPGAELGGVALASQISLGLGMVQAMVDFFQAAGVREVVAIGTQTRPDFTDIELDAGGREIMAKLAAQKARGDDVVLRAYADYFLQHGISFLPAERVLPSLAVGEGWLVTSDGGAHLADINRAIAVARRIGAEDIGQCAVVGRGQVLAVEGPEGTDAMLARIAGFPAGLRGRADAPIGVLAKLPKLGQHRALDLPTLGLTTLMGAHKAGLAGVVFEAGGALLVERDAAIDFARAHRLFLLGIAAGADSPPPLPKK